jgi:hypothetical protein
MDKAGPRSRKELVARPSMNAQCDAMKLYLCIFNSGTTRRNKGALPSFVTTCSPTINFILSARLSLPCLDFDLSDLNKASERDN